MTPTDELELKSILGAMICLAYPSAIKKLSDAYNEISKGVLDTLINHGLTDDAMTEKVLGDTIMHVMREGFVENIKSGELNDRYGEPSSTL